jgi:hypothetical protein
LFGIPQAKILAPPLVIGVGRKKDGEKVNARRKTISCHPSKKQLRKLGCRTFFQKKSRTGNIQQNL